MLLQRLIDFSDHRCRRLQGLCAHGPPCRACLFRLTGKVNICLYLPQELLRISAYIIEIDLGCDDLPFGAYDKCASQCMSCLFIINAEELRQLAGPVRSHGIFHLLKELFVFLPCEVDKFGVRAHGDYFCAGCLDVFVLICQISEFRSSDKGKISRVEK